jgi:hypothetical protein
MSNDTRKELIDGLRAVAYFYESHPEVYDDGTRVSIGNYVFENEKQIFADTAKALGRCEKDYSSDYFKISKDFSERVSLYFIAARETVCERVVVETRVVPEHVIPAQAEQIVPEKTEEVVEWRCAPLLAASI